MFRRDGFSNLSVKDLIEARELFHVHLLNKKNVVGTAIGRYLIRKEEIDKNGKFKPSKKKSERTLDNSIVIDISWPCILVLVSEWQSESELIVGNGSDIIPKTIYMPDGRTVPVCVVKAPKCESGSFQVDYDSLRFPTNLVGGGFPLIIHSQGVDFVASIACLVTDGHKYYALTNRHVTGDAGAVVKTRMGDRTVQIGVSSGKSLTKMRFTDLYMGWNSSNIFVCCDVGLIEVDDLNRWKTEVVNIGQLDEMIDLNTTNLTLSLIAEHKVKDGLVEEAVNGNVAGCGAVSGLLKGEIMGLFYRYKAVGGIEYVADFLIGGRCGTSLEVHHGDSGTLWLLEGTSKEGDKTYNPIALQWGQHEFITGKDKARYGFSLSTCFSNICRELNVDLVRGWNLDTEYIWGKLGHYTIGLFAIDAVKDPTLQTFLTDNLDNITLNRPDITPALEDKDNPLLPKDPDDGLCPLSDVPDIIWKQPKLSAKTGSGKPWGRMGDENPNHYADADAPTTDGGKILFDLCDSEDKMVVKVWQDYYANIDREKIGLSADDKISQGLICFRIWQIYNYMVDGIATDSPEKYIFGAGVLTHYVGDCCMPLHSSYMADGDPADNYESQYTAKRDSSKHQKGDVYPKTENPGKGVHAAYEDLMVDDNIDSILQSVADVLKDGNSKVSKEEIYPIASGRAAAFASLQLMKSTQLEIAPKSLVEAYKSVKAGGGDISQTLFTKFGDSTAICMARGCRFLSAIWEAAWRDGINKKGSAISNTGKVKPKSLIDLYANPEELPSMHLDTIDDQLKG